MNFCVAYWTDGKGAEVRLTEPEYALLLDKFLLVEARAEAERVGLDLSYSKMVIGEWAD